MLDVKFYYGDVNDSQIWDKATKTINNNEL